MNIDINIQKINNGDPKLIYILNKVGNPDVQLIGFPIDVQGNRQDKKRGFEYAPDCLRRFIPKLGPIINAEFEIDLSNLILNDYGNINENLNFNEQINQAKTQIKYCSQNNIFPILIGGSKEASLCFNDKQICDGFIFLDNKLYIDQLEKIEENNYQNNFKDFQNYFFGQNQNKDYSIQQIRNFIVQKQKNVLEPITQGGAAFKQFVSQIQNQNLHIQVSLDVMNDLYCPGIMNKNNQNGLNSEELIEIMFIIGSNKKIKSMSITDYNPLIEDFRTGRYLTNLIYYTLLGFKKFRR